MRVFGCGHRDGRGMCKMEKIVDFFLRGILGTIAMFFINLFMEKAGILPGVGINPVTVLTCGILGFPGLLALYGLGFYNHL